MINITDNRFILKFEDKKSNSISDNTNTVDVIYNENGIEVTSKNKNIKTIEVSDIYTPSMNAIQVEKIENINSKTASICIDKAYQLLAVKVVLEDGSITTKKIMK